MLLLTVRLISVWFLFFVAFIAASLAPAYYGMDRPWLEYELPPLEYGFSELEPNIDEETVRIHYLGHHAKYTERMNAALKDWRQQDKEAARVSIVDVLRNISSVPGKWRQALRNNGGGFVNHNLYWSVMSPNRHREGRRPIGQIASDVDLKWGSFEAFRRLFTDEAVNLFGSGYVWLCRNYTTDRKSSDLVVITTANQDSPLALGYFPVLVIDVWEHAYYIVHRNLRPKYVESWWKVVDWEAVNRLDDWWKGTRSHDEL